MENTVCGLNKYSFERQYTHCERFTGSRKKQNKVYLLLVNYTNPNSDSPILELNLKLVVGIVKDGNSPQTVEWNEPSSLAFNISEDFKDMLKYQQLRSLPFGGSAFLTKKGNIVFALVVDNYEQKMTAMIHLKNSETELDIVCKEIDNYCNPYYFPWEEKIIMVSFDCHEDTNSNKKGNGAWYHGKSME